MPFTNFALNKYVAQRFSGLTEARPQPIAGEFDQFEYWFQNFSLANLFQGAVREEKVPIAFTMIRRTRDAVLAFDQGCRLLTEFVKSRSVVVYFDCLSRFEASIVFGSVARAMLAAELDIRLYLKGSGTDDERFVWLYDVIRHNNPNALPPGHLHPLWLENDGIHGAQMVKACEDRRHLTFDELRTELHGLARLADQIVAGRLHD